MIGEQVLGYTVDEKLGSGGFGTVYRVSKTNPSGTYVRALKHITIPNSKLYADVLNSMGGDYAKADDYFESMLNDIVNEIRIISTLSESGTKNIVRYYENDIHKEASPRKYDIYILMECLTPFTDYFSKNLMTVKDVIRLGEDILTALISCHEQGVMHRDIKDDNLFVSADGTFKLGDFGESKMLRNRSKAESMKGTPNYIAPEVYLGKGQYDETVDVYSLGIVLYRLLNKGRNPFMPNFPDNYTSDDEDAAFEQRMRGEKPSLPYDAQNVLGEAILPAIVARGQRYNSAKAFLSALQQAKNGLAEDELNKVINTIVPQQIAKDEPAKKKELGKTVRADLDMSANSSKARQEEADLFTSMGSDSYNHIPVQSEPVINTDVDSSGKSAPEKNPDLQVATAVQRESDTRPVTRSSFRWVAFVLPIIFFVSYVVIYMLLLPRIYGKGISVTNWILSHPDELLETLQDENYVFVSIYKIWAIKLGMYALWIAFVASLINLGRVIQYKKPEHNIAAQTVGKEAYLLALESYEFAKNASCDNADEAKRALRIVTEKLKNESSFGVGNESVIRCEADIVRCLRSIHENVQALGDNRTAKQAGDIIVEDCKTIQNKLRIRAELKKK